MLENDGRVISNFIRQVLTGQPLTVYGDGTQTRSFCFVSDTVRGLLGLMGSEYSRPFNIGNPHERTICDLVNTIAELFNGELPVEHFPLPSDDPKRRCPDITAAVNYLKWWPEVELEEGLKSTIIDFEGRIKNLV